MSIKDEIILTFIEELRKDLDIPSQVVSELADVLMSGKVISEKELLELIVTGCSYDDANKED